MTPCQYCSEVAPSNNGRSFQCPFCGRWIAHYLPTPEEIHLGAEQIRYENEEARLSHPERAWRYLPWERTQA